MLGAPDGRTADDGHVGRCWGGGVAAVCCGVGGGGGAWGAIRVVGCGGLALVIHAFGGV